MRKTIQKQTLFFPILIQVLMWSGFYLQTHNIIDNCTGGLIPLSPYGLKGILFSPFLHGNLEHILSNSLPIIILMFLLFQFYSTVATRVLLIGWLLTGLLVWLTPPIDVLNGEWVYACVIGASDIVYMLAFFLFFSGIFQRDNKSLLTISLLVALYYGSLVWGIFPEELLHQLEEPSRISWQSHLAGAMVGIILAFLFRNIGEKRKKFIWEYPNYYSEADDALWQQYKEKYPEHFQELPKKPKQKIWEYLDEIIRRK